MATDRGTSLRVLLAALMVAVLTASLVVIVLKTTKTTTHGATSAQTVIATPNPTESLFTMPTAIPSDVPPWQPGSTPWAGVDGIGCPGGVGHSYKESTDHPGGLVAGHDWLDDAAAGGTAQYGCSAADRYTGVTTSSGQPHDFVTWTFTPGAAAKTCRALVYVPNSATGANGPADYYTVADGAKTPPQFVFQKQYWGKWLSLGTFPVGKDGKFSIVLADDPGGGATTSYQVAYSQAAAICNA